MSLAISIFGLGYVGSVSAACFAHMGHRVVGVDTNCAKVEKLQSGESPIFEAGMDELVSRAHADGLLWATTDVQTAVHDSDISFVCVGTPGLRSGKLDLSHVRNVMGEIGIALQTKKRPHTVALRSTVLPGTTHEVVIPILEETSGLKGGRDFWVCYNPEFLREGTAVDDFLHPACTILGGSHRDATAALCEVYSILPGEMLEVQISTAEMAKYSSNAFHALKVTFANEIGTLCRALNVDAESVTQVIKADTKLNISRAYLSPGFAFGGSCLPKDVLALAYRAKELDISLPLLEAIIPSNARHLERATEMILQTGKTDIAVLGLSFKPGTDDLRDSPHVRLIKQLLGEGKSIRIWDDDVALGCLVGSNRRYINDVIPHIGSLLCPSIGQAIRGAEVVVLGTTKVNREILPRLLNREQILIDLVNLERSQRPVSDCSYQGICW